MSMVSQYAVGSAGYAVAVTPNDSENLPLIPRALWIGVAGSVKVDMADGGTVTFVGIAAGSLVPIAVTRVYSTDTTASGIIALT